MYVMADLGLDEGPIEEQLSVGILGVLSPAVQQVDSKITEVRKSQAELRDKIDALGEELRVLSEKQKVPVDLDTYVKKLANSRKRILLVNDILQNVQDRLEKLNKNVAKETARQRAAIEACH
ncbi:SNARE-associated protein Snapin-like [Halichondria panicea]|uniref:SNARE-associated protein Snapin-like n=1 Tax=Halichondria panicea TaxID=6063 RepID=UPI00312BADE7